MIPAESSHVSMLPNTRQTSVFQVTVIIFDDCLTLLSALRDVSLSVAAGEGYQERQRAGPYKSDSRTTTFEQSETSAHPTDGKCFAGLVSVLCRSSSM